MMIIGTIDTCSKSVSIAAQLPSRRTHEVLLDEPYFSALCFFMRCRSRGLSTSHLLRRQRTSPTQHAKGQVHLRETLRSNASRKTTLITRISKYNPYDAIVPAINGTAPYHRKPKARLDPENSFVLGLVLQHPKDGDLTSSLNPPSRSNFS